jgi:hypothetical protein
MNRRIGFNGWDAVYTLIALFMSAVGVYRLYSAKPDGAVYASGSVAVLLDCYLLILLGLAAFRGSGHIKVQVPHRFWALVIVLIMFVGIVTSFGAMYIESCTIFDGNRNPLLLPRDGLYFSMVTLSTLGYGDYAPIDSGRTIVIFELASGLLYLLLLVPVVASRLADFSRTANNPANQVNAANVTLTISKIGGGSITVKDGKGKVLVVMEGETLDFVGTAQVT